MTRVFRAALEAEALFNVICAISSIGFPTWYLSSVVSAKSVPASATVLWQIYGSLVLAFSVPLLLIIPDSKAVFEAGDIVYKTLVAGEVAMIGILNWHAHHPVDSGFT
ncbi:hypothetical protein BJ170DRAFT_367997 [Xylariales sp. AK1849]|nr:hypothetical protein BJ170DRAFT_367997 [Xylariales sp. AK1849]